MFKDLNINHTFKISSIGSNPTHSCIHLIVLNNGNIFIIHRVNIHNISQLEKEDYIQINAPKNPSISILSDNTNEVFLGYDDGTIYIRNKKGIQLKKLQSAIIAIDMSLESIVVAVTKNGEIGIWIRNIYQLKKYIDTKNAITSLSVSRTKVRYSKKGIFATGHKNGIVTFWNFDGIEINKYSLTKQAIVAMCFFPFGLEYIGIATKKNVIIINVITGNNLISFFHNDGHITTLHIGDEVGNGTGLNTNASNIYITIGCDNGKVFQWTLKLS